MVFESNGHGVKEREVRERRRVMEMGLDFGWDEAEILMRESGVVLGVWGLDSLLSFYSEFVGYMVLTENWFKREPLKGSEIKLLNRETLRSKNYSSQCLFLALK